MAGNRLKLLCIPVEFYQREFLIKLYLALNAAQRGFQVIIGEQNEKIFKRVRDGIVIFKDHSKWSEPLVKNAKDRGMKVAALDEEALIIGDINQYKNSISRELLDNADAIFFWGHKQKNILKDMYKHEKNKYIVGCPKFDLCELERRNKIDDGKLRISKILINTRFSFTNSMRGGADEELKVMKELGFVSSAEDERVYRKMISAEHKIFDEHIKLIEHLISTNKYTLTIRPHPGECREVYNKFVGESPMVAVDSRADLRKQILDHDCVIHDGCTTAIEARALGRPVFGLRPTGLDAAYDDYANHYSKNFSTYHELINYLDHKNVFEMDQPNIDELAISGIHNWQGRNGLATKKIVQILDEKLNNKMTMYRVSIFDKACWKKILYSFSKRVNGIEKVLKMIFPASANRFYKGRETIEKKFQDFDSKEVSLMIKNLCKLDKSLPDPKNFEWHNLGKKLLHIKAREQ